MPSTDLTARMYFDQGRTSYMQADYGAAADHLKRAIETDPMYIEAHRYLGESYAKLGYSHRARKAFEALLRIAKEDSLIKDIRDKINQL